MSAVVHVELLGSCPATGPVVDALRSRARVERVSSNEYAAHVEDAADGASAVAELERVLERELSPDWDELVALSERPGAPR
ncbi:MAG: hypothetical protein QOH46_2951 [Solirubrobacteraceae bacterium]|nr:hypothetical protein [Solirubrobacteraceae bacterium]